MSKIVQDVKSSLTGIRGAGDALRGEMMEATDQAFEKNPHDPAAQESRAENRGVLEKGKRDMRGADEMFARHEWKHKAADEAGRREAAAHGVGSSATSTAEYGSDRLAETFAREPASNVPGQTAQHGIERTGEDPDHIGKYGTESRGTHAYVGETGG